MLDLTETKCIEACSQVAGIVQQAVIKAYEAVEASFYSRLIDTEYSKAKSTYNSISSEQSDLEDESAEIAAAKKKAEAEWEEIISKSAQQNQNLEFEVVQGTSIFAWPVQAGSYISSHFGSRWGTTHGGTDICFYGGAYGKPIYAAAAGTVIAAGWNNGGYGNYVISKCLDRNC